MQRAGLGGVGRDRRSLRRFRRGGRHRRNGSLRRAWCAFRRRRFHSLIERQADRHEHDQQKQNDGYKQNRLEHPVPASRIRPAPLRHFPRVRPAPLWSSDSFAHDTHDRGCSFCSRSPSAVPWHSMQSDATASALRLYSRSLLAAFVTRLTRTIAMLVRARTSPARSHRVGMTGFAAASFPCTRVIS